MRNKRKRPIGRPYGTKTQVKGFVIFLTVFLVFIGFISLFKVEANDNTQLAYTVLTRWEQMQQRYWSDGYPETKDDRRDYIVEYLSVNYPELKGEEINNLVLIAEKESINHDPKIEPQTTVKHCQRQNGTYYSTELTPCNDGDKVVHTEKSIGVFQILPSSFKGYGCEGDIKKVNDQIDCAVTIYEKSGYGAWYLSSKKLGIL